MAAPALVLLASGSSDDRVTQVFHALRKHMQEQRPSLTIQLAFLDGCPPNGMQVVSALIGRGVEEIVFVPLDMNRATEHDPAALRLVERVKAAHPSIHVSLSRSIGPAPELLSVLDLRLRQALGACHANELDGLVLSVAGGGDPRGHALISRRSRQWRNHHKLPVQIGFADNAGPSVANAVATLRAQGRRAIAVGSLFIAPDQAYQQQAEQARRAGAVAVSAPLGVDDRILELAMARYSVSALLLLDEVEPVEPEQSMGPVFDFDNAPIVITQTPPPVVLMPAANM
jgi:sirohydrochlorin ferrochelatase